MGGWQRCLWKLQVYRSSWMAASKYYLWHNRLLVLRSDTAPCEGVSNSSCLEWVFDIHKRCAQFIFRSIVLMKKRACRCAWIVVVSILASLSSCPFAIPVTLAGCTWEMQGKPALSNGAVRIPTWSQRPYYLLHVQWWSSNKIRTTERAL